MIRIYSKSRWSSSILFCIFAFTFLASFEPVVSQEPTTDFKKCLSEPDVEPKKYAHYMSRSRPISLEVSNRITHQLSTHVFAIFLQEIIGYDKVEIIHHEDFFEVEAVIERLTDTTEIIPKAWINLEVWVPPEFDTFSKLFIKECGNIAPPGRFGWFIPKELKYPIEKYYERWSDDIMEVHWEFFKHPQNVQPFDLEDNMEFLQKLAWIPESKEYYCNEGCTNGMYIPKKCQNAKCGTLLTSYYNATSFVKAHIDELDLNVKVIWLGDNLNRVIDAFKHSYRGRKDKSLIILGWTPSDTILHQKDYISVAFKRCELLKSWPKYPCKYEMHRLVKFAWSKVENFAKPLDDVLKVFTFKEAEFDTLMDLYNNSHNTSSIHDIACEWMKTNRAVWSGWKQSSDDVKIYYIGGIFPITGNSYNGKGIAASARMATKSINANKTILPNYEIQLLASDGACKADNVMRNFIDFMADSVYSKKLLGVLGPACSDTVEPLAGVAKHYHMMVISYSAEGAIFSDRKKYPYFFRTIGENQHYKHVYLNFFKEFGWRRVAALTEDGQKYTEYISSMQDELEKKEISFIANKKFPRERETAAMSRYLQDLKSKRARIIISDVVDSVARNVMCEAFKLNMTARDGYVWFLPMWLNDTWYHTDYFNEEKNESVNCTTADMIRSITGYFSMTHAYFAPNDSIMQENITVGEWRKKYASVAKGSGVSSYAGFAYDAVWTYALALDKLSKTDPEALSDLHSENTTKKLVGLIEKTDFFGVSGRIKFRGGPSRFSVINIMQWYNNRSNFIGYFYPNLTDDKPEILGGTLSLNRTLIKWFTPDGRRPDDGTLIPVQAVCAVQGLANFLRVQCTTAIIILNVLIGIFIISVIIFMLRRSYRKKSRKLKENYLKTLGLDMLHPNLGDLDKWEVPRSSVVINRKLGEGAFGTVYGGEADLPNKSWVAVAVKTLKVGSTSEEKLDFLSEAEVMKRFDHKNIVQLLGVCTKNEPVYTIMEFMLYGDLKTFLLARRHLVNKMTDESEEISPKKLTSMALDVARGLSYLAELKYVHRDVASRNCLVNAQRVVKLGDFGMTRPMFENDYYKFNRKGMLPVRWMSPESLGLGIFTPASDVWSYGVLLYEIITFGSFPFQGKSNSQVLDLVKAGHTLDIPQGVKPQLEYLIKSCWYREQKDRPTASEIVEFLATNQKLLEPCLDVPLSSVQLEDTDQLEIHLPNEFRKCSSSFKSSPTSGTLPPNGIVFDAKKQTVRETSPVRTEDAAVNIPMENCCPKEPLLGTSRSSSSLLNLNFSKYVTIQHNKMDSGCPDEEEYVPHSPPNGHVVTKV